MPSKFAIKIVRNDGTAVLLKPGAIGERDLKDALLAEVRARGVGIARTANHVVQDVSDALDAVLLDLKSEVEPVL